jgi:hypothetical protein
MKTTIAIILIGALIISLVFSGCTQTNPPTTPTNTPITGDTIANDTTSTTITEEGANIGEIVETS